MMNYSRTLATSHSLSYVALTCDSYEYFQLQMHFATLAVEQTQLVSPVLSKIHIPVPADKQFYFALRQYIAMGF